MPDYGRLRLRTVMAGLLISAAAILMSGNARAAEPALLRLIIRSDYLADDTIQKFTAETGIAVTIETYNSDDEIKAAMKAGNPRHWDLAVVSGAQILGDPELQPLFQPVQTAMLGNYRNIDPEILGWMRPYDPDNQRGVPYLWGTAGLVINVPKLKTVLPDAPLDSLALVFNPGLAALAQSCGLAITDDPADVFPAVLAYLGLDPASQDPRDLGEAGALLARLKPYLRRLGDNDFTEALAGGNVCVGFGASTVASDAKSRAEERDNGVTLTYVIPKEPSRLWVDVMAIPATAENPAAARNFINFMLRPEIISDVTDTTGAANPNLLSTDFVDDADKSDETLFPSALSRARLFLDHPHSPAQDALRRQIWEKALE